MIGIDHHGLTKVLPPIEGKTPLLELNLLQHRPISRVLSRYFVYVYHGPVVVVEVLELVLDEVELVEAVEVVELVLELVELVEAVELVLEVVELVVVVVEFNRPGHILAL
jgi:hypothetical protein